MATEAASTEDEPATGGDGADADPGTATEAGADDAAPEVRGHPVAAFVPRLAVWAGIIVLEVAADPDPALSLMLIALAGVATIVTDSRLSWERYLERYGVPTREAWVPILMLGLMLQLDLVQPEGLEHVLADKGPVLIFIMAFALISEGLRRSGFIHFLAYRLTDRGGANTTRLTLYLFLLSSLLTYFTSNDIVVLTMTPIVVSVAWQARIRNAKLMLLSQFIAANTVSMGILIGSPTNLILGQAMNIRFVEYLFLMLAPSVMALMFTFVFVTGVNWFVERHGASRNRVLRWLVGTWTYEDRYSPPRFSEYRSFTPEMRTWVGVFTAAVLVLTVGTATNTGLLIAGIAIGIAGIFTLRRSARRRDERTGARFYARTLKVLPFGIVFFGITYFALADAIADTEFVREDVDEYVTDHASSHTPVASWGSMLASGGLVNTMNDLPASALAGTVLERVEFATPFDRAVVVQGALAGLNIATYVTPVGALAGIIWFDILRRERQQRHAAAEATAGRGAFDVVIPTRRDLVVYGTITFLATTLVLGATNFGFVALADALLSQPGHSSDFAAAPTHAFWTVACLAVAAGVLVAFRRVLTAAGVALTHLGDVLVVLTQVRLWASRHRLMAASLIAGALFAASGVLLYWAETFHAREYDRRPLFEGVGEFVTWLAVFVSSGFEGNQFPRSALGRILSAALALGSIATLVVLIRISTGSTDLNLRRRLARGEIPSERLVVVNCGADNRALVRTLVERAPRFVAITSRDAGLEARFGLRKNDRVDVIPYQGPAAELVTSLRLHECNELVLLSRSVSDDFENLALLAALDAQGGQPPAVLLQVHERDLPTLLAQRVGPELQASVARLPFDVVVRSFLVADVAGLTPELQRLYSEPLVSRTPAPDIDPHIRVRGLGDPLAATLPRELPRSVVHVVGAGCFAQTCAVDLAAVGVADVRLVMAAGEALLPGVAGVEGLTVVRCASEVEAADLLAVEADPEEAAILVLDGADEAGLDAERLLERLSLGRLHHLDAGRQVPFLFVGCQGADRAWRIGNFVVDKVVDTTWVEASYFAVFSTVYFDVLLADEELANWPPGRQLVAAHRVASLLCHLDVAPLDRLRSEPAGSVHIDVEHVDGRPVLTADVKMVPDEQLAPTDLALGIFYR